LHCRWRSLTAFPTQRAGGDGGLQRADYSAVCLPLVRSVEGVAVRRLAHPRSRGRALLHAGTVRHYALAGPCYTGRCGSRVPADLTAAISDASAGTAVVSRALRRTVSSSVSAGFKRLLPMMKPAAPATTASPIQRGS